MEVQFLKRCLVFFLLIACCYAEDNGKNESPEPYSNSTSTNGTTSLPTHSTDGTTNSTDTSELTTVTNSSVATTSRHTNATDPTTEGTTSGFTNLTTTEVVTNLTTTEVVTNQTTPDFTNQTTTEAVTNQTTSDFTNQTITGFTNQTESTSEISTSTTVNPPHVDPPKQGKWLVKKDGKICIKLNMAAQLKVRYETTDRNLTAKLNVPKNANAVGECNSKNQIIQIPFGQNMVAFRFIKKDSKIMVDNVEVNIFEDEINFPGSIYFNQSLYANVSASLFKTDDKKSWFCKSKQTIKLAEIDLDITDLQVEAFMTSKDDKFDTEQNCDNDKVKTPVIVPIIVGCVLGGMLLIVIIAFFIGKRRYANRPYESL